MRWKGVCKLALQLPEVEEGTAYGVPALQVRGGLVARLLDDKKSILVKVDLRQRATLCATKPETFSITRETEPYAVMVVRLARLGPAELWPVLVESWRRSAPPDLASTF